MTSIRMLFCLDGNNNIVISDGYAHKIKVFLQEGEKQQFELYLSYLFEVKFLFASQLISNLKYAIFKQSK